MKKEIKAELIVLKRFGQTIWTKDHFGKNIFLKEVNEITSDEKHEKKFFSIFDSVDFENKLYEACVFVPGVSELFIDNLFNMIASSKVSIKDSITDIINYFSEAKNISIEILRGLFAELYAISKRNLSENHATSIYDFLDDEVDFEIKSFSKVKREIMVSFQQLTNSSNAKIMAIEVFESNQGMNVLEMIRKLDNLGSRYSWLLCSKSKLIKTRFKIGQSFINDMSVLSEGLSMPYKAKSAKFIFSVEELKNNHRDN